MRRIGHSHLQDRTEQVWPSVVLAEAESGREYNSEQPP
jgi:hypothetical protein